MRAPLGRLQRWREVGGLPQDLSRAEAEEIDGVPDTPVRVLRPGLGRVVVTGTGDLQDRKAGRCDPLVLAAGDAVSLDTWRARVVLAHLQVVLQSANAFARLRHFPHVVGIQPRCNAVPIASVERLEELLDNFAVTWFRHQGEL